MDKDSILNEFNFIEKKLGIKLPTDYKKFLSEEVRDEELYEIERKNGDCVYIYNYKNIIERNETYEVQMYEPNYFLIGQDGDLGFFICLKHNDTRIYSLDLGALGSLDMDEEELNIYDLIS